MCNMNGLLLQRNVDGVVCVGDNVRIKVTKIQGNRVWLLFEAPRDVRIDREEVALERQQQAVRTAR